MKSFFIIIIMTSVAFSGLSQSGDLKPREVVTAEGITIEVYDFEGLRPLFESTSDTTFVINFWATWCRPCVEEMPYFTRLSEELQGEKVKFVFISLDFRKNLESGIIPFIQSKGIKDTVVLLHDPNADKWISAVSETWSGAIPATLVFNQNKRAFYEKMLHYEELSSIVQSFIQ